MNYVCCSCNTETKVNQGTISLVPPENQHPFFLGDFLGILKDIKTIILCEIK